MLYKRYAYFFLFFFMLTGFVTIGQVSFDQMVIGALGSTSSTSFLDLSYTVGEPIITTESTSSFIFTQGFHQPYPIVSVENTGDTCPLNVYHGISPNTDGNNDFWDIDNISIAPENKVYIYDRAGSLVWYKENYDNITNKWIGTKNSGDQLPVGTYFYVITSTYLQNKECVGWVQIIN